ncbi:MAG: efflux RND transporter periplasmic adaptor subunit [Verrucomicrobiota bacterium]
MARKKSGMKWLVIALVLVALGGIGFYFWKKSRVMVTEYRTTPVTRGEITQSVTASGQINPVKTVQVGSQVSGILDKINVDFNSTVTNGQLIAQLDPATFQASVSQAEGEVANTEASLELTRLNAERAQSLFKDNLLAKADYDKTVAELHQAEAAVKIRKAALQKARVDLSRSSIYSPIDGVVISREVDVGQTVAASLNAPVLFKIANDLAKMQIDAMISEADIGGVEVGQEVKFTVDAFPTRTFQGKVIQVRNSPVTTQNVVTYDTVVEVDNRDLKLKPGMTASVSVVVAQKENALKIPNAALRFRPPETDKNKSGVTNATAPVAMSDAPVAATNAPRQGGGGREGRSRGPGGPAGNRNGGPRPERAGPKTIYLAEKKVVDGKTIVEPKAVQIRTGVTDGIATEVVEGLKEGDEIITGIVLPEGEAAKPAANPFGGGMRRF